jgi:hypothetical protein
MNSKKILTAALIAISVSACAGPRATGVYQSHASYDKLYAASLGAVTSIGYTVTASNKTDGMIVAQQGVLLGGGSAVGLNATITAEAGARVLHVAFVAPPATLALGSFGSNLQEYIGAVRTRVPDLIEVPGLVEASR